MATPVKSASHQPHSRHFHMPKTAIRRITAGIVTTTEATFIPATASVASGPLSVSCVRVSHTSNTLIAKSPSATTSWYRTTHVTRVDRFARTVMTEDLPVYKALLRDSRNCHDDSTAYWLPGYLDRYSRRNLCPICDRTIPPLRDASAGAARRSGVL